MNHNVRYSEQGTAYQLVGCWDADDAPVLVLIHGLGLNSQLWQDYIPLFAHDMRIIFYDLFGHGHSVPPPEKPSLTVFAEQLHDLLQSLTTEHGIDKARCDIILMGFSLGGMINRRFALDYPNDIAGLIILNAPHERNPEEQERVEKRARQTHAGGSDATLEDALQRWFTEDYRTQNPEKIDLVRTWRRQNDAKSYPESCEVLAKGVLELIRLPTPILHPSLIITTENDSGSTPVMAQSMAREMPDSQCVIIPDLQHMGLMQQPELFAHPIRHFIKHSIHQGANR